MQIVLASSSARRREILSYFSLPFIQLSPEVDERKVAFQGDPKAYVSTLAEIKAEVVAKDCRDEIVLSADTIVYAHPVMYPKPQSHEEAFQFLSELSGRFHEVWTALCVVHKNKCFIEVEMTKVYFHDLKPHQIQQYLSHIPPLDKAGGYGIQQSGGLIVKKIEGCFFNVMGMPLNALQKILTYVGIDLWNFLKKNG